ncbi:unnamed protein product [Paramecium sonneborni]|uniref:SP-RING-type domain-containing protein n=1 Tax=Paramecium sonneborni TaxID=65129 RepID=A0A8S1MUN3_9CILI|nr:unnamed protein product [Paramecium sonneborni]
MNQLIQEPKVQKPDKPVVANKKQIPIPELVQTIKTAHGKLQNIQTDFEERTKKFSNLTSTMTVSFECSVSKEIINYAVYLAECFKGYKHYDQQIDLEQFLKLNYFSSEQQQTKQLQCPICKTITKFEKIEQAFYPHLITNYLREKCGQFPRQLMYNFKDKIFYPLHKGKMGNVQNSYFDQIHKLMKQNIQPQGQFYQIVKNLNVNYSFLFYNNCSLSQIKVMLPVRGLKCAHFEVYDLTALLYHFDKKEQSFKCKRPECNSIISYNEICLDIDLFNSCLKSYSFTFSFIYNHETKQLEDILEREKDQNLLKYRQLNELQEYLNYQSKIYKIVDQIYTSPVNQENTEEFYTKNSIDKIKKEKVNFMFCQFTGQRIELPCRCIRCTQVQTCDLRFMSCVLNQFQNPAETNKVLNVINYCPLCKNPFTKKIRPKDLALFDQVYVDVKMMNFLTVTTGFANITQNQFIQFLNNKVISRVIVKRDQESILKGRNAINRIFLKCPISKQKILRPIRGNNCVHAQPFDFGCVDLHQNGEIDLNDMKCPVCNLKFDYFLEDLYLKDHLEIFYAQQLQECEMACLNLMEGKLLIKPKFQ